MKPLDGIDRKILKQLSQNSQIPLAELSEAVTALNADRGVHGILIQEPLPKGVDGAALVLLMDPRPF